MKEYDYDRLRDDLINYFGTAAIGVSYTAFGDLTKVEKSSNVELIEIAKQCGFNLDKYIIYIDNAKNSRY